MTVNSDRRQPSHNILVISLFVNNGHYNQQVLYKHCICHSKYLSVHQSKKHGYHHVNMVKLLDKPTANVVMIHLLCIVLYKLTYTYVKIVWPHHLTACFMRIHS